MSDKKDLQQQSKYVHQGSDNTAPYPVSRMAPAIELVDLAKEIAQADEMLGLQVNNKLHVIADQIRHLQGAAREILEQAQRDQELNHAECHFKKVPGATYHLYLRTDGRQYLSILSPADWNDAPPHTHQGAFQMNADHSWKSVEECKEDTSQTERIIRGLLGGATGQD